MPAPTASALATTARASTAGWSIGGTVRPAGASGHGICARRRATRLRVHVETLPVGPLGCNCSILADLQAKRAIVIDPGGDYDEVDRRLGALGVVVDAIVHTHTHVDHVGCTAEL